MKRTLSLRVCVLWFLCGLLQPCAIAATPSESISLWPNGQPPGPTRVDPDQGEQLVTSRRRTFRQYTNISVPNVNVFLAPEDQRTGAAVLVCPGGGMQRLAYEHEGLEIADWLNPLGISVFVLKYRVPGPSSTALLDTQRAMGLIRQRAHEFKIDPERLGAMGFSAGGELVLLLATHHQQRGYDRIDAADDFSCRPSHACLIYPGGITSRTTGELRQNIAEKLDPTTTPAMFIVHAFSDASMNSFALGRELKRKNISTEMHIYQEGGHGFGARESALPLSGWKTSYLAWIRAQGFFDPPYVSRYALELAQNLSGSNPLRKLSAIRTSPTLAEAYAVQRKVVAQLSKNDRILGFKAGPVTPDPVGPDGPTGPATGVLFASGKLTAQDSTKLTQSQLGASVIETELGFVVSQGLDISTRVSSIEQIRGAFESVIKVIELPHDLKRRMQGELTSVDFIAANIGSRRVLVAETGISPDDFAPDKFSLALTKDGETLHTLRGNPVDGGIWERLIVVVNRIIDQGYTLRSGDLVISGALGTIHPAQSGTYVADYGTLGKINFVIE